MTTWYYDCLWRTVDDVSTRAANIDHHGMVNNTYIRKGRALQQLIECWSVKLIYEQDVASLG